MVGQKYIIAGMLMEIIEDVGDQWKLYNHTTNEPMFMSKDMLAKSVRLGKAEVIKIDDHK